MRTQRSRVRGDPGLAGALEEVERVLATALVELMDSEEERAHARELTRQANVAPALARFRELLVFVGEGHRATQAGKLTPTDAIALASSVGAPGLAGVEVRSMEDLPDVANLFHWAVAADLLTVRGARSLPAAGLRICSAIPAPLVQGRDHAAGARPAGRVSPRMAQALRRVPRRRGAVPAQRDPQCWRRGPVAAIEELVWQRVAAAYGYQLDNAAERRHVSRLVQGIFAQLADLGAAEPIDQRVRLTELGGALAAAASADIDNDDKLLE
jgi:hypothetical protein